MNKKYEFYLAGPFFTKNQITQQKLIECLMHSGGKSYFSPRLDAGTLGDNPTKKDMLDIFNKDLEAIDNCEKLFANVSYRDTGTSVEIGYALAKNIPVILFWDKDDHDVDHVNLMIALACGGNVIQDKMLLNHYINTGELINNDFEFKVD